MFKKMMLAIAVVVVPTNLALAASDTQPALEQMSATQEFHAAELSLPGIVIDQTIDKVEQKIAADCQAYLKARLAVQEHDLMTVFTGQDVRISAAPTSPMSSGS